MMQKNKVSSIGQNQNSSIVEESETAKLIKNQSKVHPENPKVTVSDATEIGTTSAQPNIETDREADGSKKGNSENDRKDTHENTGYEVAASGLADAAEEIKDAETHQQK